jgi:hypothetical protein
MPEEELDAHHITPREDMPNGGYVKENGVTLCKYPQDKLMSCHEYAEAYLNPEDYGVEEPGYSPAELYKKIGSSYQLAYKASEKLGD